MASTFWNCSGILAWVYCVEVLCHVGGLFRQIRGTASAKDHDIDLILHFRRVFHFIYRNIRSVDLDTARVSAGKYCDQLRIRILADGIFNTFSQVAVAGNCNTNLIHKGTSFLLRLYPVYSIFEYIYILFV